MGGFLVRFKPVWQLARRDTAPILYCEAVIAGGLAGDRGKIRQTKDETSGLP
jgi:hypothetical protein